MPACLFLSFSWNTWKYLQCWQDTIFPRDLCLLEAFLNPSFVSFSMESVEQDSSAMPAAESETVLLPSIPYMAFLNQLWNQSQGTCFWHFCNSSFSSTLMHQHLHRLVCSSSGKVCSCPLLKAVTPRTTCVAQSGDKWATLTVPQSHTLLQQVLGHRMSRILEIRTVWYRTFHCELVKCWVELLHFQFIRLFHLISY